MAYPEISKKYKASVCIAGITEDNEFRRIYPVPFDKFVNFGFHKKQWIRYEIKEKGDYRAESYKIRPETLKKGDYITDDELRKICNEKCKTIEELKDEWETKRTSLGIIKPIMEKIKIKEKKVNEKAVKINTQTKLEGERIPVDLLKYDIFYKYKCHELCNGHMCKCLDTEAGQLYRNLAHRWGSEDTEIIPKMEHALFDRMKTKDLYFLLGTHSHHPKSWMIISLLHPPKPLNKTLFDYQNGICNI
jgi:hypothetical protein